MGCLRLQDGQGRPDYGEDTQDNRGLESSLPRGAGCYHRDAAGPACVVGMSTAAQVAEIVQPFLMPLFGGGYVSRRVRYRLQQLVRLLPLLRNAHNEIESGACCKKLIPLP